MNTAGQLRILTMLLALTSTSSHALQIVDARDGVTVKAVISRHAPTRIRIEHAPIADVYGNVRSSHCAPPDTAAGTTTSVTARVANPTGEIVLDCDREKGEIYVRPVGTSTKPINLFIASANATYTLLLRRSDTPSDTIVIRDRSVQANQSTGQRGLLGPSANHVRAMKALLVALATDRSGPGMQAQEVNQAIPLWKATKFVLLRTIEGRGLVGERYLLSNHSGQTLTLSEQQFDQVNGSVVGVAIENLHLRPGDSTNVYVLRVRS